MAVVQVFPKSSFRLFVAASVVLGVMAVPAIGAGEEGEVRGEDLPGGFARESALAIPGDGLQDATITLTGYQGFEGDTGTRSFTFSVSITGSISYPFTATYRTRGAGEGEPRPPGPLPTATPWSDYGSEMGSFNLNHSGDSRSFTVDVFGDIDVENDEFFWFEIQSLHFGVNMKAPGIIEDDDVGGPTPSLAVNDVALDEGQSGTRTATFNVTLSPASSSVVEVEYSTCGVGCHDDATATGGEDYAINVGTLTFNPGQTSRSVPVTIYGDTDVEPDEVLFLAIFDAVNAAIADDLGRGTIRNDDSAGPTCFGSAPTILGTPDDDVLRGTSGDDVIVGLGGSDRIMAGGGNDKICGGDGADKLFGGPGNDKIHGNQGNDEVNFSSSAQGVTVDLLLGTASGQGNDFIESVENVIGSRFDDFIYGTAGSNWLRGIEGDDYLDGDDGNDVLGAGPGDDLLVGGDGDDTMFAFPGADLIDGGRGNDSLGGGAGDDSLYPGAGDDTVLGGYGTDLVSYYDSPNPVTVNLYAGNAFGWGSDTIGGVTWIEGSPKADTLNGNGAANLIFGLGGNDTIDGRNGNDDLFGEEGNDHLIGGPGSDWLWGGSGTDSCSTGEVHDSCETINAAPAVADGLSAGVGRLLGLR